MLTTPHPELVKIMRTSTPYGRTLIWEAIRWGLRYYQYPMELIERLEDVGVNIDLISNEVDRQLDEMPSLSYH